MNSTEYKQKQQHIRIIFRAYVLFSRALPFTSSPLFPHLKCHCLLMNNAVYVNLPHLYSSFISVSSSILKAGVLFLKFRNGTRYLLVYTSSFFPYFGSICFFVVYLSLYLGFFFHVGLFVTLFRLSILATHFVHRIPMPSAMQQFFFFETFPSLTLGDLISNVNNAKN